MQADALGRRPWTMKEVNWLRAFYRELGPHRCAEMLNRTAAAVVLQAMAHGAGKRKAKRQEIEETIRGYHAQGLNDQEIAAALGWVKSGRERVAYWRRKILSLPANETPGSRSKEYGARGARAACRNNSTRSLVEVRWQEERIEAARLGWFGADSLAQVRILESLRGDGPATARQIIERQGFPFRPGRYHATRGHLARLIECGLVSAERKSQVFYNLRPTRREEANG